MSSAKTLPLWAEDDYRLPSSRLKLYFDETREESAAVVKQLRSLESDSPDVVVVVGGDGMMLRAIRRHWSDGLPIYGVNTGHLGFLLNDVERLDFWELPMRRYRLPLLSVDFTDTQGRHHEELAFNDCWIERETGQTAWIEVAVNGVVRMPRVVADGMLIATAAGSTSYARAMGASPLPFNAPLLTLAGSNVLKPEFWHPAVLTGDSVIRLRNLDPDKRPLRGFTDGISMGPVQEMTVRVSAKASVELLFTREHDPVAKLAVLQFP